MLLNTNGIFQEYYHCLIVYLKGNIIIQIIINNDFTIIILWLSVPHKLELWMAGTIG